MRSLELFAGIGGLALGTARAGFDHAAVIEKDKNACATLHQNKQEGLEHIRSWSILQEDVRHLKYGDFGTDLELLSGGVPCQPWSMGGKHMGQNDQRNLFPEMIRAVREIQPQCVLIENVKGLLRESFSSYFEYIILSLSYPDLVGKSGETWKQHLKRLEQHHTSNPAKGLQYNVIFRLLNAADYGVPQKRERVFIVAFRNDLHVSWSFPQPTHSRESLAVSKWVTHEYWDRHGISKHERPAPTRSDLALIERADLLSANMKPWSTARDALSGLPQPARADAESFMNHILVPGARSYAGHTGSLLDEPAKTLKAGDHGVPGGENTVVTLDGEVRYFTIREAARIQGFPDHFVFPGSWTESMRQLGNAVPVDLAKKVASSIRDHLLRQHAENNSRADQRRGGTV